MEKLQLLLSLFTSDVSVLYCLQAHIASQNAELSQAALQTLGFCVYHSHVVAGVPGTFISDVIIVISEMLHLK